MAEKRTARRDRGSGAIFRRHHMSSCGPGGADCPYAASAPDHGLYVGRIELPAPNGARRRKEVTATTLPKLHAKLDGLRKEYAIHGDLPTASQTVEQWMAYWLENVARPRLRPNTFGGYVSSVKQITAAIGNVRLDKLQPAHIRRMHTHITDAGRSSTYALSVHRILARALKDAQAEGIVTRNVAALIDAPRKNTTTLNALTAAEAISVIARAIPELDGTTDEYDPTPARWATYLLTGMRRGEVLGLEWERMGDVIDLSWQLQRITDITRAPVDYEYRPLRGPLYLTRPKSRAGWRVIPLVPPLSGILAMHLERSGWNEHGLVFTIDGQPIDPDNETDRWMTFAEREFGRRIRLHDTRHTTVDLLYAAGVKEADVQKIIGHSEVTTTRGYRSKGDLPELTSGMKQLSASLGF